MRRALIAALLLSCGGGGGGLSGPVEVDVSAPPPDRLSDMRLLRWDAASETIEYNDRVVPYDLNTALFSDFSLKARAIYLPEGEAMDYDAEVPFSFPVGSVIVKTFYFPADFREPDRNLELIETRVLRRTSAGWEAWPYIWNEEQSDATLRVGGDTREISFLDEAGEMQTSSYLVPQRNQCTSCHQRNVGEGGEAVLTPIGPAARHLNRDFAYLDGSENQLMRFASLGMLNGMPALGDVPAAYAEATSVDDIPAADLDRAARDYLDINCAHCHDPLGTQGVTSQLFLNHDNDDAFRLGVCKRPGSAGEGNGGLTYDIVPGDPDDSILVFRVETTEIGAIMPLLGRSLQDTYGAALLRRWVAAMEPLDCEAM
ncbi:MAG: SO2930 family diheme c-type cytochrome [Myxococcota bacterium]